MFISPHPPTPPKKQLHEIKSHFACTYITYMEDENNTIHNNIPLEAKQRLVRIGQFQKL